MSAKLITHPAVGGSSHEELLDAPSLLRIALEHGTPVFVCLEQTIAANVAILRRRLVPQVPVSIYYSYKTNWLPGVGKILHRLGLGAEVVSGFELHLARRIGVPDNRILFNGPGKSDEELRNALSPPVGALHLDSVSELNRLLALNIPVPRELRLGLRLSLDVEPNLSTFGVRHSDLHSLDTIAGRLAENRLVLDTLHAHVGQRIKSLNILAEVCERIAAVATYFSRRHGINVRRIDLGGGFVKDEVQFEQMAVLIDSLCTRVRGETGLDIEEVIIEPGRFLVDDAFVLLTSVLAVKNFEKKQIAVVDAGINILGTPRHRVTNLSRTADVQLPYQLKGPLCCPGDVVCGSAALPPTVENDILCVSSCGAYTLSTSSQFIKYRAPVVLIKSDGSAVLMRRRETYADMVALDITG